MNHHVQSGDGLCMNSVASQSRRNTQRFESSRHIGS
jgi:hypothetical protein